jgi:hypothetical protein
LRALFGFFFFFFLNRAFFFFFFKGTSNYCNLKFNSPDNCVGETQCIICLLDGKAYLLPVSERFDTLLNNRVVHRRVPLRSNDVITVGERLFWIQITGGVHVERDSVFDLATAHGDFDNNDDVANNDDVPVEHRLRHAGGGIPSTPIKLADAVASTARAAVLAVAKNISNVSDINTTLTREGALVRAVSTVVVRLDDENQVDAVADAVPAASFMSPPHASVAAPTESAPPPPKQTKRKAGESPVSLRRRNDDRSHARMLQRAYQKEQEREEQEKLRQQAAPPVPDEAPDRADAAASAAAPVRRGRVAPPVQIPDWSRAPEAVAGAAPDRGDRAAAAAVAPPVEVAENSQNSHSVAKSNAELNKLSTNSSRFAKQWAPAGKRRTPAATRTLQF